MKIFMFITVAALISVTSPYVHAIMVGGDQCTWGPAYWCHNITAAVHCRSVKYCADKFWKTADLSESSSSQCDKCIVAIKTAEDQLMKKVAEKDIKDDFNGYCDSQFNTSELKTTCKSTVDYFYSEIVEIITSKIDPRIVCHLTSFCTDDKIEDVVTGRKPKSKSKRSSTVEKYERCKGCLTVLRKVNENLKSLEREQILKGMTKVFDCKRTPTFDGECKSIAEQHYPIVYEFLKKDLNVNKLCGMIGVCPIFSLTGEDDFTIIEQTKVRPIPSSASDDLLVKRFPPRTM